MKNPAVKSKYAAGIVGVMSLLFLLIINLVTSATISRVWVFGYETHIGCWFKEKFHTPCPLCGMTRSVILTLHGNFGEAFQMHIGGPPAILGIAVFGMTMLYLNLLNKFSKSNVKSNRSVLIATTVYFGIVTLVAIIYWLLRISGYFQSLPELL